MFPAEFGGPDEPRNRTYLPPELAARKRAIDAEIRRRIEGGEEHYYRVTPEYDNDSFVPARLRMEAAREGATPRSRRFSRSCLTAPGTRRANEAMRRPGALAR